jgi:hypothetical protein
MMACKAGAKKVYAIESDAFIQIAKEVVAENGLTSKIEFIHNDSRFVKLPEKADVAISNIGFLYSIKCLPHAAKNLLKKEGKMIPSAVRMHLVPYTDETFYRRNMNFWDEEYFGFKFDSVRKLATHHPHYMHLETKGFLAEPQPLQDILFAGLKENQLEFRAKWKAERGGTIHMLGGWYEFCADGKPFISTAPPCALNKELWNNFVLPLSVPIEVRKGDIIEAVINLGIHGVPNSLVWSWKLDVNAERRIEQSSFESHLFSFGDAN